MDILILHQNFPGQFKHIARHLKQSGHRVLGMGQESAPGMADIAIAKYRLKRRPTQGLHRYVSTLENGVIYGQSVAQGLIELKKKGLRPDIVLAHPGWGEALYVKDIFPQARLISFFEFYYHGQGADVGFDPEEPVTLDDMARLRTRNALHLLNLETCDAGVSPTQWQKSLHPKAYQDKISIVHEGIDTSFMVPNVAATVTLPNGKVLRAGDPVVTYVGRNLEPYRGFKTLMRSLPHLLGQHPTAQVLIVGADGVSYGKKPANGKTWPQVMQEELGGQYDTSRVHFLGRLPYDQYRTVLQISAAHIYLTFPFVLSWSMLEAMSCGCLLIGSATAPVEEVITHGQNGLLVDFFDPQKLAAQVLETLRTPSDFTFLRRAARETVVNRYGLQQGIVGYEQLLFGGSKPQFFEVK